MIDWYLSHECSDLINGQSTDGYMVLCVTEEKWIFLEVGLD